MDILLRGHTREIYGLFLYCKKYVVFIWAIQVYFKVCLLKLSDHNNE